MTTMTEAKAVAAGTGRPAVKKAAAKKPSVVAKKGDMVMIKRPAKRGYPGGYSSEDFHEWQAVFVKLAPTSRIESIRTGLEAKLLVGASEYFEMPRIRFGQLLGMSASTMERKIKEHALLGSAESEKLARLALIEVEAEKVFGKKTVAREWLLSKNTALGDSPMSLLDTELGSIEVRKMLNAIAYGGVA